MYYPHNFHDGFCWEVEAKSRVDVLHIVRLQNGFHLSMSATVQVILLFIIMKKGLHIQLIFLNMSSNLDFDVFTHFTLYIHNLV